MSNRNSSVEISTSCGCKLGRTIDQYKLGELNGDLVAYWTGDGEQRFSTRKLATYVNRKVLRASLEESNVKFKDGEVENTYRLLTDDDVSSGTRVQTRNELQRDGVPIDNVESNFVSHQTVYNHLTECLDASLETPSDEERLERSAEKLGSLQNRTEVVTTDTIAQLDRNEIVDIGDFEVTVSITATCKDCFQEYTIRELLESKSCNCSQSKVDGN